MQRCNNLPFIHKRTKLLWSFAAKVTSLHLFWSTKGAPSNRIINLHTGKFDDEFSMHLIVLAQKSRLPID